MASWKPLTRLPGRTPYGVHLTSFTFQGLSPLIMVQFEKFKNWDTQESQLYVLKGVPHKDIWASAV